MGSFKPYPLPLRDALDTPEGRALLRDLNASFPNPRDHARLDDAGTGIYFPRPASHFDVFRIRRFLTVVRPRLKLARGHAVEYDRPLQTRQG